MTAKTYGLAAAGIFAVGLAAFFVYDGPRTDGVASDESPAKTSLGEAEPRAPDDAANVAPAAKKQKAARQKAKERKGKRQISKKMLRAMMRVDERYEELKPEEKRLYDKIQELSDNNCFEELQKGVPEALAAENPYIRLKAVESLMPYAEMSVFDIIPCLADDDEEVREAAVSTFESGLQMMDDDAERIVVIKKLLDIGVLNADTTLLIRPYIENMEDPVAALEILIPSMEKAIDENARAELAEAYLTITDEEFIDLEHAQAWVDKKTAEEAGEVDGKEDAGNQRTEETRPAE